MYPILVSAASATTSQARSASSRAGRKLWDSGTERLVGAHSSHGPPVLWRTSPTPLGGWLPQEQGYPALVSSLVRRVVAHSRDHRSRPNRTRLARLAPSGARGVVIQDSRVCRTIASAGYAEYCCGPQWSDGESSCRACYCACSVQWRESWPACRGACLRWVRRGIPGDPGPAPKSPGGIGAVRLEIRAAAESPVAGATKTAATSGDPIACCGVQQACLSGVGPQALFCFLPSHPRFRSLPSPSLLQPHSTLCLDRRLLPRPIPNWPVVLGPLTSCVVRTVLLSPIRHPATSTINCCAEAANTFFPHLIRNTKL